MASGVDNAESGALREVDFGALVLEEAVQAQGRGWRSTFLWCICPRARQRVRACACMCACCVRMCVRMCACTSVSAHPPSTDFRALGVEQDSDVEVWPGSSCLPNTLNRGTVCLVDVWMRWLL